MDVFFGVVQKPGADAPFVIVVFQYVEVLAALAALPELSIVGQVLECHRAETQLVVHLEHGSPCGYAEYLGLREEFPGEFEYALLDALGQADAPEFVGHYKAGVGHKLLALPALYIGEACEAAVVRDGNHGLAGEHFFCNILGRALCYAGTAFLGGQRYLVTDGLGILDVAGVSHQYRNIHRENECLYDYWKYDAGFCCPLKWIISRCERRAEIAPLA